MWGWCMNNSKQLSKMILIVVRALNEPGQTITVSSEGPSLGGVVQEGLSKERRGSEKRSLACTLLRESFLGK